jgi:hypothetical protein
MLADIIKYLELPPFPADCLYKLSACRVMHLLAQDTLSNE